ncbi:MAG TPA: hypothetical protein VK939_11455 [Longimicrobiales bacterium]|nr:hypothetical protein [Longimicrobiales bacterium]
MKSALASPGAGAITGNTAAGETSLESFVAQLHREGVAAGQREAERLVREAREEAEQVLRRAAAEAEALLAEARERAAREHDQARAELELAARDTVLQLRSALDHVMQAILQRATSGVLQRPEFLAKLVREVVGAYARGDAAARLTAVHVPYQLASQLEAWTAEALAEGLRTDLQVLASLREWGFEYRLSNGGTVEVTTESVVERLQELVRPRLREIVAAATQAVAPREHLRPARAPRVAGQHR